MHRHAFSYKDLADALNASAEGPTESVQALINKVNRGRFSFAFFLRACLAMGVQVVDVADLPPKPDTQWVRTRHVSGSKLNR